MAEDGVQSSADQELQEDSLCDTEKPSLFNIISKHTALLIIGYFALLIVLTVALFFATRRYLPERGSLFSGDQVIDHSDYKGNQKGGLRYLENITAPDIHEAVPPPPHPGRVLANRIKSAFTGNMSRVWLVLKAVAVIVVVIIILKYIFATKLRVRLTREERLRRREERAIPWFWWANFFILVGAVALTILVYGYFTSYRSSSNRIKVMISEKQTLELTKAGDGYKTFQDIVDDLKSHEKIPKTDQPEKMILFDQATGKPIDLQGQVPKVLAPFLVFSHPIADFKFDNFVVKKKMDEKGDREMKKPVPGGFTSFEDLFALIGIDPDLVIRVNGKEKADWDPSNMLKDTLITEIKLEIDYPNIHLIGLVPEEYALSALTPEKDSMNSFAKDKKFEFPVMTYDVLKAKYAATAPGAKPIFECRIGDTGPWIDLPDGERVKCNLPFPIHFRIKPPATQNPNPNPNPPT